MLDILLDTDGDLLFVDGDVRLGESTIQHQGLLLELPKGHLKESPLVGVGAAGFLKDENVNGLLTEIKSEFEKDGMQVTAIYFDTDNKLNIDASY